MNAAYGVFRFLACYGAYQVGETYRHQRRAATIGASIGAAFSLIRNCSYCAFLETHCVNKPSGTLFGACITVSLLYNAMIGSAVGIFFGNMAEGISKKKVPNNNSFCKLFSLMNKTVKK